MAGTERRGSPFLAALIVFVVVGGGIYLAGLLVTALLKHVILPLAALVLGGLAARTAYRLAGKG